MISEDFIKLFTLSVAGVVEGLAAMLVALAIGRCVFAYLRHTLRTEIDKMQLRLSLGKSLALALEFLLAADILRTAIAPTWDDIGKLAAIAALRTLLNYFLARELKSEREPDVNTR